MPDQTFKHVFLILKSLLIKSSFIGDQMSNLLSMSSSNDRVVKNMVIKVVRTILKVKLD